VSGCLISVMDFVAGHELFDRERLVSFVTVENLIVEPKSRPFYEHSFT
jgi:hypothetical protein